MKIEWKEGASLEFSLPQLYLLLAPRQVLRSMIASAAAHAAFTGPLRVIDGGNLFDVQDVERRMRSLRQPITGLLFKNGLSALGRPGISTALERIRVVRAHTCYQLEALLARQAVASTPVFAPDLLATFADENASLAHRAFLLEQVIGHLRRLAGAAPVLVGVVPASELAHEGFIRRLEGEVHRIIRYKPVTDHRQMSLF